MDLATGVLAFASAKNIAIVGDLQQLPNVLDNQNIQKSEEIWGRYSLPEYTISPPTACVLCHC